MLIGIPRIMSPELLKILMEMGHGEEIVLADGNFPAVSHASQIVRADGHGCAELLDAILALFPLDTHVDKPAVLMKISEGDNYEPLIWHEYGVVLERHGLADNDLFEYIDRESFYERARRACAIVTTGESALYGNIILRKGVIK